ncbi:hypothetical protein [Flavobacterium ginsengiterrae]|uniref:hypothetical protein n=1 Tax=Flavobacterium ginsengiterrae TaxID=871695 RepID=UPI0031EC1EC1
MLRPLIILLSYIPTFCLAQEGFNPKISYALETYAFLKGQDAALEKVAGQFPKLSADVRAAEKKLDKAFGQAEYNINQYLKKELEYSQLQKFHKQIDSLLDIELQYPVEKESHAKEFLKQVVQRPENMYGSAVSKGILSFKYHNEPHQEILDGHVNIFETKDHPKADNVSISVPIPASWLAEETAMPQTIQQFTSCNGNGTEKIFVVLHDLSDDYGRLELNTNTITNFLSPQSNLIRTEPVSIDGVPAYMAEVEELIEFGGRTMKIRMLQFLVVKNQKLYCIQGSTLPSLTAANLEPMIRKNEKLFRLIADRTDLDN